VSKKKSKISTQEAALRQSLGICGPWENLGRDRTLALKKQYNKIIDEVASVLADYESSLTEICRAMNRLNSINPFSSDLDSLALKAKAVDDARSLLRRHGLPFPLPATVAGRQKLKKEWPSIKARRRRAIRARKCKELLLPLNSSWEQIQDELARRKRASQGVARERLRRQSHPSNITSFHPYPSLLDSSVLRIKETAKHPRGYVYLKRWRMPTGVSWYKVGVTSNPSRRHSEQNVLPVPAETIACVEVESMERARSVEADFRRLLAAQRIRDASNRELYELTLSQLSALQAKFIQLAGN
jgi:hypothetical protein